LIHGIRTGVKVVVRVLLALIVGVLNVALRLRRVSLIASLVDTTVTNVGVARHDGCVEVVFLVVGKEEFCEEMRCMLYEKKFNRSRDPFVVPLRR